jgi:hypothetical protein
MIKSIVDISIGLFYIICKLLIIYPLLIILTVIDFVQYTVESFFDFLHDAFNDFFKDKTEKL